MSVETVSRHLACPECNVVNEVDVERHVMGSGQAVRDRYGQPCGACGALIESDD